MKTEDKSEFSPELETIAAQRAADRARAAKWDLNIAIYLFSILIIIIIMASVGAGLEIMAPVAIIGLAGVWFIGWRRGKRMQKRFFAEEMFRIKQEILSAGEETVEQQVQKAFLDRRKKD